jgi:hypothetical protein
MTANAQSNYTKGYIITNENDTINGLIDFRTDKINCSFCKFKLSKNAEEKIYYPQDLIAYRLIKEGKYYVSRTIIIDNEQQKVFLEYLVQGIKDLFYYPQKNDCYYIEDENGKMIAITKEPDKIVDNKYITDNKYKGILSYIFRSSKSVSKKINKAYFDRRDMINLTKKYHTEMCAPGQECIVFANDYKKSFLEYDFSIYGGIQLTEFTFEDNVLTDHFKSAKSIQPVIGCQINISSPRLLKTLSTQIDISISKMEGCVDYISNVGDNAIYEKYKFKSLMTDGSVGLKYALSSIKKIRPTIEAGVNYALLFNSSNSLYKENRGISYAEQSKIDNYYSIPKSYYGFNAGAGFDYQLSNNHSVFCRVLFSHISTYEASINNIQLKLGFTF